MKKFFVFFTVVLLQLFLLSRISFASNKPILWNYKHLREIKSDIISETERQGIIKYADQCLSQPYVVVTEKTKSFCDDYHYYSSIGIYWWPDENSQTGMPYINKDGVLNPEYAEYDYLRLITLSKRLKYLSLAFFFTRDMRYYDYYVGQVEAWFVNKETLMYPNFEYAQVIPGRNNNKGRGAGLTEAVEFNTIIESFRLINSCRRIKRPLKKEIIQWFRDFSDWMANSETGKSCSNANDNTAICYDVILLNMSIFSENKERSQMLIRDFKSRRIDSQIDTDGRYTAELKRTKAYYYSIKSLSHIVDFSLLAESLGYHVYRDNKKIIDKSVDYLYQFVSNREEFGYNQISDWEGCEQFLILQIDRLSTFSTLFERLFESPDIKNNGLRSIQRLQYLLQYE